MDRRPSATVRNSILENGPGLAVLDFGGDDALTGLALHIGS